MQGMEREMLVHTIPEKNPSLLDMLADPIIQSEMVRDGATDVGLDNMSGAAWNTLAGVTGGTEDRPEGRSSRQV